MPTDTRIDVHLDPAWASRALRTDVAEGLTAVPKELPPKWFYDDRGSELFDEITRLDEYYPFRREREILRRAAPAIATVSSADTLIELGSGTSEKTRILLDAMRDGGQLRRYVPFDVSEGFLRTSADEVAAEYPGVEVVGVVGDFEHHLTDLPAGGRRMVALLGGTIGNLDPPARKAFLADVASGLEPGDSFLLGTDLVKDPARLVAAYDDACGVTAAFNRNVLAVVNRELGADFVLDAFEHVARWDDANEWIEMRLRSTVDQRVRVPELDLEVCFAAGEEMRTEISAKFRRERVEAELADVGLELAAWWTDTQDDYALSLAVMGRAPHDDGSGPGE